MCTHPCRFFDLSHFSASCMSTPYAEVYYVVTRKSCSPASHKIIINISWWVARLTSHVRSYVRQGSFVVMKACQRYGRRVSSCEEYATGERADGRDESRAKPHLKAIQIACRQSRFVELDMQICSPSTSKHCSLRSSLLFHQTATRTHYGENAVVRVPDYEI